ncbi:MAG TPA: hypothetical protein VMW16_00350 [Sedimentisphaerales bacterium]|nr:hypothetical protein [Sedimentisphaerales bacterium]
MTEVLLLFVDATVLEGTGSIIGPCRFVITDCGRVISRDLGRRRSTIRRVCLATDYGIYALSCSRL